MDFEQLFSAAAGPAFDRQLALAELLGERSWNVDMAEGIVQFGDDLTYGIQLLGSQNDAGNWLWAWANAQSDLPAELLEAVGALREIGEQEGIDELSVAQFDLPEGRDGHHLAMVAGQILGAHPYYRGPYPGGALYFLVVGVDPDALSAARPRATLPTTIGQVIASFELDHRVMIDSLLDAHGFEVDVTDAQLVGTHPAGDTLTADFDELGRVANVSGTFGPDA